MAETKVKLTIEITVDDDVTMKRFGKPSDKTTMGEYRKLLLEALEEAPAVSWDHLRVECG